jgi:hypothetical protein
MMISLCSSHGVSFIGEETRQRVDKNSCGLFKIDAMIPKIQPGLAVIPPKAQPHNFNFDGNTSRVRANVEFLSQAAAQTSILR